MDLRDECASLVIASLSSFKINPEERRILRSEGFSGITLFRRNISPNFFQVSELTESIQKNSKSSSLLGLSQFIAIDQEGGRVARIRDSRIPDAGAPLRAFLGRSGIDEKETDHATEYNALKDYGFHLGKSLRSLGINTNFAPVLDLYTEPSNTAIGDRCFGFSLEKAKPRAKAFIKGLDESGICYSLKHFPGQGDAQHDTHFSSSSIEVSLQTLLKREISMFTDFLSAAPMVMISHAIFPELDHRKPASLSPAIISELLIKKLNYKGLVVSDDMLMKAVDQTGFDEWAEKLIEAIVAGTDLLLVCNELVRAVDAVTYIEKSARRSLFLRNRISESSQKVLNYRSRSLSLK